MRKALYTEYARRALCIECTRRALYTECAKCVISCTILLNTAVYRTALLNIAVCRTILLNIVIRSSMPHCIVKYSSMPHLSRYYTLHVIVRGMRIWPLNAAKCCKNAGKFFPDVYKIHKRRSLGQILYNAISYTVFLTKIHHFLLPITL